MYLEEACPRTRSIEGCDNAVRGAHETVKRKTRVSVMSRNHPCRVDAKANGAEWPGTRRIKARYGAVRSSHVGVTHVARLSPKPRGRPRRVDAVGAGALAGACAARGASNVVKVPSGARR